MTKSQKNLKAAKDEVSRLWRLMCLADNVGTASQFVVFSPVNPYATEYNNAMVVYQEALMRERKNAARRARHEAYTSCGLKAVRVNGETIYE